jgi:Zn-dependent protease with chaperone function
MSNAKVIQAYVLFALLTALIPGLLFQHWLAYSIGAAIVVSWWAIASVIGDKLLLNSLKAEPLNVVNYGEIAKIVTSRHLGPNIGPPSLWVVHNLSPMILSIGLNPRASHIVLTKGLLEKHDDKVQLAMVVRELESIKSGRTSQNTGLATLLWFILLPGRLCNLMTGHDPGEPNALCSIVNLIPAFIGAFFVFIATDKTAVYSIDKAALKQLENPDYLPYALMKLQDSSLAMAYNIDLAASPCCAINPNSKDTFAGLYKAFPATPKRIERLRPHKEIVRV